MALVTFTPAIGGDGSTVSDDANPLTGLDGGGHRTRFVPALAQFVAVAGYVIGQTANLAASVASATASKNAANQSAIDAAASAAAAAASNPANFLVKANNLSDLPNLVTARSNLGVAIGTNVQAYHGRLASISGLNITTADNIILFGAGNIASGFQLGSTGKSLMAAPDAATARTALALAAIAASGSASDLTTGTVPAARLPAIPMPGWTSLGTFNPAGGSWITVNVGTYKEFLIVASGLSHSGGSSSSLSINIGGTTRYVNLSESIAAANAISGIMYISFRDPASTHEGFVLSNMAQSPGAMSYNYGFGSGGAAFTNFLLGFTFSFDAGSATVYAR